MLIAFVTTVRFGCGDAAIRSARVLSADAIAVLVVPPHSPTTAPRGTKALAACAICSFAAACSSRLYRSGRS